MTEDEAQDWILDRYGVRAHGKLEHLVQLVKIEAARHNIVSASTLPVIWNRHIVDSAQLLTFDVLADGLWLDIGTGGGFPGLVIACLRPAPIALVEPRTKRATFLADAIRTLGLLSVDVVTMTAIKVRRLAKVISARAVAPLTNTFAMADGSFNENTLWLLPKGRHADDEIAHARLTWSGVFHVEHSVTDDQSRIVVASRISRG